MYSVYDLDGTLAEVEGFAYLIDGEKRDWDAYFAACCKAPLIHPIAAIYTAMQNDPLIGDRIEIWTGRSETVRAETEAWLQHHGLRYDLLLMRPAGDYQPVNDLKGKWLDDATAHGGAPDVVFDDRSKAVDWWRSRGIVCLQVAGNDY